MRRLLIFMTLLTIIATIGSASTSTRSYVSTSDADQMLRRLDRELEQRDNLIDRRSARIDSIARHINLGRLSINDFKLFGKAAIGFDNGLALNIFSRGQAYADSIGDHRSATEFKLRSVSLMPLSGVTAEAIEIFQSIDTVGLDTPMMRLYYEAGSKMYGYIATIYRDYPMFHDSYDSLSLRMMSHAVALNKLAPLPAPSSRLVTEGEYLYLTGRHNQARKLLLEVLDSTSVTDNNYAIAAYLLASIAGDLGNENELTYYLALSALADTRAATREVTSLQRLGQLMLERDDIGRAHSYLSKAMQNAAEAHVATRMVQTAAALPLIEQVHNRELELSRRRIYTLIVVMAILIVMLAAALVAYHRKSVYRRRLQEHLEASNLTKEIYISRFLDLCAIYMDKLNQFCKVASNKISTGQVDELYRLTKSGKFVEHNSSDFYEVFDDAFLHMYPDFLEKVNKLLRDDAQITLRDGEKLNTDLRILAFMHLGIDDTARVGRILNYSVNTIYAYRNKLRNRAIDRDNFEAAIAAL